jgi:hypothetical protein
MDDQAREQNDNPEEGKDKQHRDSENEHHQPAAVAFGIRPTPTAPASRPAGPHSAPGEARALIFELHGATRQSPKFDRWRAFRVARLSSW